MNAKFFDVNKDKQDSIINAALKLFAQKGYKDASTDVIVKAAGISKGLLFHYFGSKQGLYSFICDYSTKYMTLELTRTVKENEKDFFEIMSQIELGKTRVARNYPYMHSFLRSIKYEKDPEAIEAIGGSIEYLDVTYRNIYGQISTKKFIHPDEAERVISIIQWVNDGFTREKLSLDESTPDEMYEEFSGYLNLLRSHFYKSDTDESISVAKEEVNERDETIMEGMRMDMTFEERLQAGKRPLVDTPAEGAVEKESEDSESDKKDSESSNSEDSTSVQNDSTDEKDGHESIDDIIEEAEGNLEKNEKKTE